MDPLGPRPPVPARASADSPPSDAAVGELPDGCFVTASADGGLRLWSLGPIPSTPAGGSGIAAAAAASPGKELLALTHLEDWQGNEVAGDVENRDEKRRPEVNGASSASIAELRVLCGIENPFVTIFLLECASLWCSRIQ